MFVHRILPVLLILGALIAPLLTTIACADELVVVNETPLGNSVKQHPWASPVFENSESPYNDIKHAPQYLPYYPTAGVVWPRVEELQCREVSGAVVCDGYEWKPAMGRAEYLYVKPVIQKPVQTPPPKIIEKTTIIESGCGCKPIDG